MASRGFGTRSKVFAANFPGQCGTCEDRIEPGDKVRYEDDELVHESCPYVDVTKAPRNPPDVCPECNIDHAGKCF